MKMAASSSKIYPSKLPPTERSAWFHSLRTYFQAWECKTLEDGPLLEVTDWEWKFENRKAVPIMTDQVYRKVTLGRKELRQANYAKNNFAIQPVAPDDVISVLRCNCKETKKGCCTSAKCSCRTNGLKYVSACGYCRGDGCDNSSLCSNGEESDDDDAHNNIFEIMLGYYFFTWNITHGNILLYFIIWI